jgi:hypothetical protein
LRHLAAYLGRDELRSSGEIIPDQLLAHVAPLGWEHIAFNGDSVWPADLSERVPPSTKPPRRIPRRRG